MTCPSQLTCSMYADRALSFEEAAEIENHLAGCRACRELVAGLGRESRMLATVLQQADDRVPIPDFHRPLPLRHMLGTLAAITGLALGPLAVWAALSEFRLPSAIAWVNPFNRDGLFDLSFGLFFYLVNEGASMMSSIVETVGIAVLVALIIWGVVALLKTRTGTASVFTAALAAIVLPSVGQALEIRRSEEVLSVPAAETIDDTLIAFGDSIEIDGTVNGDLIAFGRRVIVRGTVEGQLFTGAQDVEIRGTVGGSVLGFAESLQVAQAEIGRNFVGFARQLTTSGDTTIEGNAIVFAADASLRGPVGIDVMGFTNELQVSGNVDGDVTAYASRVTVLAPARIGGNVLAHVGSEDDLQVSSGATVTGTIRTEVREREEPRSELVSGSFYAAQAVRFGAAFVTGFIVLGLATSLRRAHLGTGMEALTTAGVGLVTAVAVPIISLLVAITLIGIPVAVLMFLLWSAALYFAKILFAHFLGRRIFESSGRDTHFALALLVGLLIVLTATNIPFVGGLLNFLMTITGLGMLVIYVWGRFQGRGRSFEDREPLHA